MSLYEVLNEAEGELLKYYDTKKAAKEKLLKNRKKRKKDADNMNGVENANPQKKP